MAGSLAPIPEFLYGTAWKKDPTAALTEQAAIRYEKLPELAFRAPETRAWLADHQHR